MSVDQIHSALDSIGGTPRDRFLADLEEQLVAAWTNGAALDVDDLHVDDLHVERASHSRPPRRRWLLAAAAAIVVLALGLVAMTALQDPDSVETDTVPPASAPTTNPAPPTQPATIPPTVPATTSPAPTSTTPTTGDELPSVEPVPFRTPELYTDLAPDSMIDLPAAPIGERTFSGTVWTGTEMIGWGGRVYDPVTDSWPYLADGAAFDLANGAWRVIAPAPISGRDQFFPVWTGTEMIVWGGYVGEDVRAYDGAAYNPATDTWRTLPPLPFSIGEGITILSLVWTGDEVVVSGGAVTAAYDPVTDSWRRLADRSVPGYPPAIWTGESIVWTQDDTLIRYDVAADIWTTADGAYAAVVAAPSADAATTRFVALPKKTGEATQVLNRDLQPIGELPAFPGELDQFGAALGATAKWVGDEVIFWIWKDRFPYEPEQVWALDLTTESWRRLDPAVPSELVDTGVVAGDVMLTSENAYRSGLAPSD